MIGHRRVVLAAPTTHHHEKVFKSWRLFHLHLNRGWIFLFHPAHIFPSSVSWYECAAKLPAPINHPGSRACLPPRGCAPKLSLPFKPTSTLWKKGKWSFGAPWSGKISVLPSNEPRNPDGDDDDASGRWNAKVRLDTENRCKERVSLSRKISNLHQNIYPIRANYFTRD